MKPKPIQTVKTGPMQTEFEKLRLYFGNHKAAAKGIGVSYSRYNDWRAYPEKMPQRAVRQIEYAVEAISKRKAVAKK